MADQDPIDDADPTKVDAAPTKAFFVEIITRDIPLDKAIQDLVDNCVDGAKRLRPGADDNYEGLWVKVEMSETEFRISDNCGGIPLETARKHAFKFGRPKGFQSTPFSVGQFGVGMKRALFKMGNHFKVTSVEPNSRFDVEVDVPTWSDQPSWDFHLSDLVEDPNSVESTGTVIEVKKLHPGVASTFRLEAFKTNLRHQIRVVQQHFMRKGLKIFFGDEALISSQWQLNTGEGIDPSFRRYEDDLGGTGPLRTRLYAGIGASSSAHAGWYIFCNGRCILDADQSSTTGWSEATDEGVTAPKYHGQFARFRGYAFLDCEDASILPWNTTKTDLDFDSDAYRRLRGRLIEAMRPVIDFLNELDAEKDFAAEDRDLSQAVGRTTSTPLERLPERAAFSYRPPVKRGPALTTISYKRTQPEVDRLKAALQANSNREIGEKSFTYTYENLVEED